MNRRKLCLLSVILAVIFYASPLNAQINATAATSQNGAETSDVYKIGGDVSAPILISSREPELPPTARRTHDGWRVLVNFYVEKTGVPSNVHTVQVLFTGKKGKLEAEPDTSPLGREVSESAVKTIKQYRFKPALKNGKPVRVELNVDINF